MEILWIKDVDERDDSDMLESNVEREGFLGEDFMYCGYEI